MAFQLHELQSDIRAAKLDGWLFYDFRGRDPIAHRILDLPQGMRTRRWFYFVPAKGRPSCFNFGPKKEPRESWWKKLSRSRLRRCRARLCITRVRTSCERIWQ